MKALVQRVKSAQVTVGDHRISQISKGFLVFIGMMKSDTQVDLEWMVKKIIHLRIFPDDQGRMKHGIQDISGEILLVSQFTLCADLKKGSRPSFSDAMEPTLAKEQCAAAASALAAFVPVQQGQFGAMMDVSLVNDGPVTIWLDSKMGNGAKT